VDDLAGSDSKLSETLLILIVEPQEADQHSSEACGTADLCAPNVGLLYRLSGTDLLHVDRWNVGVEPVETKGA